MHTEKKSKVDSSIIIDNPDFLNFSFFKFFSSVVQTKSSELIKIHQQYHPADFWKNFKKDYQQNNLFENCTNLVKVMSISIIYAFIPGWFFLGLLQILFSTIFWQFTITKIQILIHNHRLSVRTSVITRPLNLRTLLSIVPFLIGFSYFLNKKYPAQLNQYFFEKNLPGLSLASEKLHWDTVQYILKPNLKKEISTSQSFCQDNSLLLESAIFEDSLGQKGYLNKYKKRPGNLVTENQSSIHQDTFILKSTLPESQSTPSGFQNLDELPAYLESFFSVTSFSDPSLRKVALHPLSTSSDGNLLDLLQKPQSSAPNQNVVKKNGTFKKPTKTNSLKKLSKILFQSEKNQPNYSQAFLLGLNKNEKNEDFNKLPQTNFNEFLLKNTSLVFQKEFQDVWEALQGELRTLFIDENFIFNQTMHYDSKLEESGGETKNSSTPSLRKLALHPLFEENYSSFFQPPKDFSLLEQETLLEEILSYFQEAEIVENPFQTRRMSGYRYPDMTSFEINRLFLQKKWSSFWFRLPAQKSFLQINLPSSFLETKVFDFHLEPFPKFKIATKPTLLKDFQQDKVLYKGPGILLEENTGLDWKTEIINNPFEVGSEKQEKLTIPSSENSSLFQPFSQENNTNLRLWFQRYISPYTPFSNSLQTFYEGEESSESSPSNITNRQTPPDQNLRETKQNWLQNLPIYNFYIERISPLNNSLFFGDTKWQIPFLSSQEWETHYQKILENKARWSSSEFEILEEESVSLPIVQTLFPKFQKKFSALPFNQISFPLSLQDSIDYTFNKNLLNCENSNLFSVHNENTLETSLEEESFETIVSSGKYKKNSTIFAPSQSAKFFFHDNWEPLGTNSWLIISQIGFAYFVFQILKALAENYGRELLVYLLDLVAFLGVMDEELKQEIDILIGQREKGFRIISNTKKNFSAIAGVKSLLPEVAEIVWFLRNSARNFSISKTLPRGILLTGPPGTGKTLLVQALAAEARVPVLALSGSSLVEPGESGALKLEILFQEARQHAPCIVFIDEIDTLARKRDQVMQNPMGADEILEVLTSRPNSGMSSTEISQFQSFLNKPSSLTQNDFSGSRNGNDPLSSSSATSNLETQINQQAEAQQSLQKEQLSLLMQFLIELDGIQGRDGVIVIGATNRPEVLDSAVLRPGRFDRIVELGLPGYHKRIEIFKLYSQNLDYDTSISWDYFAERTAGFTAADLASIMNESSLKAILNETSHTLQTIEHGIDRITTTPENKKFFSGLSPKKESALSRVFETNRVAYYQAGKILCTSLLRSHPPVLVAHLWPRRPNLRALKIAANLQKYFFQFARRDELEHRIIGCYAGKVAEILFLQKVASFDPQFSSKNQFWAHELFNVNLSTLGLEDLSFGQVLIKFLIEKWYLFSAQSLLHSSTELSDTRNFQELSEEKIEFFDQLSQTMESTPRPVGHLLPGPLENSAKDDSNTTENRFFQNNFSIPWWQQQISYELEFVERSFADWYRIYLPNPEETEINPEWLPPDEFYHRNKIPETGIASSGREISTLVFNEQKVVSDWFKNPQFSDCSWNDLGVLNQNYQEHSLMLQSFNKALLLVEQHREILDALAAKLLTEKVLRQWDIHLIFEKYNLDVAQASEASAMIEEKQHDPEVSIKFPEIDPTKKVVVNSGWGPFSRRKKGNWIDFESLSAPKESRDSACVESG